MSETAGNNDAERVTALTELLTRVEPISRMSHEGEPEAQTLAYSLVEISDISARLTTLISAGEHGPSPDTAFDHLHEIREGVRHLLYHINDSEFLRVVDADSGK